MRNSTQTLITPWGLEFQIGSLRFCLLWHNHGLNDNITEKTIVSYNNCIALLFLPKLKTSHSLLMNNFIAIYLPNQSQTNYKKNYKKILLPYCSLQRDKKIITIINIIGLNYQGQMQEMLIQSGSANHWMFNYSQNHTTHSGIWTCFRGTEHKQVPTYLIPSNTHLIVSERCGSKLFKYINRLVII